MERKFSFESLDVYQTARILVKGIYLLQNKFPKEEKYALGDQIRRAATSITSNIAEGCGRNSYKEKIHFIEIAFGSMTESFSQLQNAQDLGYIKDEDIEKLRPLFNKIAGQLSGLRKSFENILNTQKTINDP
ncbi:MAG: four helix bundle protein [Prevotella sp.]|nr:four helix bundle protein [Candidatus Prevotella equi]